jgi:hypothetical protein
LRRVHVQCVCASGADVSVCVSVCALQSGHMWQSGQCGSLAERHCNNGACQSLHSHSCRVEHGLAIRPLCPGFEHPVQLENQVAWQLERLSKARSTAWHHDCSPIRRPSVEPILERQSVIARAITLGSCLRQHQRAAAGRRHTDRRWQDRRGQDQRCRGPCEQHCSAMRRAAPRLRQWCSKPATPRTPA